ncbi:MAG: 4-hydroxythreonine-4-phosphate dehydrogenase PdxA [Candidatus Omnitrophica bacterium]|nr:4-hydroxythreonine-4-phosphate dehydrogenase PdxA [Candidatus Omnitrophota bacterium]
MNSKAVPISKYSRIKVGITFGDPSGIGPFIIAKALSRICGLARFAIIGDRWVFKRASGLARAAGGGLNFIDLDNVAHADFRFGRIAPEYGRASMEYLDKAMEMIRHKKVDCLVTGPISKTAINLAGYRYSGHTEYLAEKNAADKIGMMLLNDGLRFALVTRHISVKQVPQALTAHKITATTLLAYSSLKKAFLIKEPRIVVCGLNPHASDNGLIGREESQVIAPAVESLRSKIRYIEGPLPADAAIAKAKDGKYDCVIAMYHDQAMIPLKLLGRDKGVNLTLGLDFIRTSPLHGTAFDIAGTNQANPGSFIEAVKLALQCTLNLKKD